MDINALLSPTGDVDNIRQALHVITGTLQDAAYDYAVGAANAANTTLNAVQNREPCVVVWPLMHEYQMKLEKAQNALSAASSSAGLLLNSEETGDAEIDEQNLNVKVDSLDIHIVSSIIEGAVTRMNLALNGIPKGGSPGERCTPIQLVVASNGEDNG